MLHCIRNGLWIAPIFVLAGCWQKIEYTGKPVAAAKKPDASATSDVAADITTTAKPADVPTPITAPANPTITNVASAPPAPDFSPPPVPATPIPAPPPVANPKPAEDDRYAGPPKTHDAAAASRFAANDTQPIARPEQQSPKRHTDATPVSATVDIAMPSSVPGASPKVRRAVWVLGSRLCLAALAHDRQMEPNKVSAWLDEAQSACKELGTTVTELPEPAASGDPSPASRQVIAYLLAEGQRIGRELAKKFGPEQAALFEVALKSNLLILLYNPGSDAADSISAAIVRAAPQAKLPDGLWSPLVNRMNKKASIGDVRDSVHYMRRDIDAYLANAAEPAAR